MRYKNPSAARVHLDSYPWRNRPDAIESAQAMLEQRFDLLHKDSRPGYHWAPPSACFMNDINAPFRAPDGSLHVHYQLTPQGDHHRAGGKHWGQWRSRDLLTYEDLPVALAPEAPNLEHCFSGTSIPREDGRIQLCFTAIGDNGKRVKGGSEVWMAVSSDPELTRYEGPENPIVLTDQEHSMKPVDWRDPYFFTDPRSGRRFLLMGGAAKGDAAVFLYEFVDDPYRCPKYRGILFQPKRDVRSVECAFLVPLGDQFLLGMSCYGPPEYYVGSFDPDTPAFEVDREGLIDQRRAHYADTAMIDHDGRCLVFGYIGFPESQKGWNGVAALIREVTLSTEGRLIQRPAADLSCLITESQQLTDGVVCSNMCHIAIEGPFSDCKLSFVTEDGSDSLAIDLQGNALQIADGRISLEDVDHIDIFIDRCIAEVFSGRDVLTVTFDVLQNFVELQVDGEVEGSVSNLSSLS